MWTIQIEIIVIITISIPASVNFRILLTSPFSGWVIIVKVSFSNVAMACKYKHVNACCHVVGEGIFLSNKPTYSLDAAPDSTMYRFMQHVEHFPIFMLVCVRLFVNHLAEKWIKIIFFLVSLGKSWNINKCKLSRDVVLNVLQ